MSQPQPQPAPAEWVAPIERICIECGETVTVKDPAAVIMALHLHNECERRTLLSPQE